MARSLSSYAKALQKYLSGNSEWKETFMKYPSRCKVISAEPGEITYEFEVTKEVCNTLNTLHGGCTATLIDVCMGNLVWDPNHGHFQPGVSVDMHISFLNAAKLGDIIVIQANTLKKGKRLAFLEAKVYRKSDNAVVAMGRQSFALSNPNLKK